MRSAFMLTKRTCFRADECQMVSLVLYRSVHTQIAALEPGLPWVSLLVSVRFFLHTDLVLQKHAKNVRFACSVERTSHTL